MPPAVVDRLDAALSRPASTGAPADPGVVAGGQPRRSGIRGESGPIGTGGSPEREPGAVRPPPGASARRHTRPAPDRRGARRPDGRADGGVGRVGSPVPSWPPPSWPASACSRQPPRRGRRREDRRRLGAHREQLARAGPDARLRGTPAGPAARRPAGAGHAAPTTPPGPWPAPSSHSPAAARPPTVARSTPERRTRARSEAPPRPRAAGGRGPGASGATVDTAAPPRQVPGWSGSPTRTRSTRCLEAVARRTAGGRSGSTWSTSPLRGPGRRWSSSSPTPPAARWAWVTGPGCGRARQAPTHLSDPGRVKQRPNGRFGGTVAWPTG